MSDYYLAIDIGASSGRHILGTVNNNRLELEEIHRFDNKQLVKNGHVCWDMDNLWLGIVAGLKKCTNLGKIPKSIGIDTWGVDYCLLDKNGDMIGDPVAYRDSRTDGIDALCEKIISPSELYAITGIQKQPFNTIYQLLAQKKENEKLLETAESLLMIPDYFGYLLTGVKKQEYTNATTTGLVNASDKTWDFELIKRLGFPQKLFWPLSMPGTVLGNFKKEIADEVGFNTTVIIVAGHDTGSAFLAVPAKDNNAAYISSGTWSLLGVENNNPITSENSRLENFTNEGGAWYRYRYLKNIMGLWMIQSIRRELNGTEYVEGKQKSSDEYVRAINDQSANRSFPDLIAAAKEASGFIAKVNVNDNRFLAPDSMISEICKACKETGQPVPKTVGELMQCVYLSLSDCYRDAINNLSSLTGKNYTSINIVGGGCRDMYLNELTAKATGLPVYAGPIEGTAIGNLVVQMINDGVFKDLTDARNCIRESFDVKFFSINN